MPPTPRRSTILEVARLAGASKTSVSRYFGEERERLSPSLQARIAHAAAEVVGKAAVQCLMHGIVPPRNINTAKAKFCTYPD